MVLAAGHELSGVHLGGVDFVGERVQSSTE